MYGLNDEPTWRSAWTARLNFDCSKSRPPTMAFTSPVELSSASSAPCTPDSCSNDTRLSRRGIPCPLDLNRAQVALVAAEFHGRRLRVHLGNQGVNISIGHDHSVPIHVTLGSQR